MLSTFEPKDYLSKRANGTYCVISSGMPVNNYTTKDNCLRVAAMYKINLPDVVWCAKSGCFVEE